MDYMADRSMPYDWQHMTDDIHFDDSLVNDAHYERPFAKYYADDDALPSMRTNRRPSPASSDDKWQNVELANSHEINEAFSRELEDLFSQGVRGLLTTYMQKALQPAIKETLMESMGYTLSYG